MRPCRFRLDSHAELMCTFCKTAEMARSNSFPYGFAEICQKSQAGGDIVQDISCGNCEPGQNVVAVEFPEEVLKSRSPVHAAGFPAVGGNVTKSTAHMRPAGFQNRPHHRIPIKIKRFAAEMVKHQSLPGIGTSGYFCSSASITYPDNLPFSLGRSPIQQAVCCQKRCEVNNFFRCDQIGIAFRRTVITQQNSAVRGAEAQFPLADLIHEAMNAFYFLSAAGKCQHSDVTVETIAGFRLRRKVIAIGDILTLQRTAYQKFGGIFRGHDRTAEVPSALDIHSNH